MVAEKIDHLRVAFSRGVEERGLLEGVLLDGIHAQFNEYFDHFVGKVFVWDDAGVEQWGLTEIFGLIEDQFDID